MKIQKAKQLTDKELIAFTSAYQSATYRKQIAAITLVCAFLGTLNLLTTYGSMLETWQLFMGSGIAIVVYGVVGIFILINDTAHDIISSMRPDLED